MPEKEIDESDKSASKEVDYSVVVPVHNSEGTLQELHQRLVEVFKKLGGSWELVLVNDYSRDNSWKILQELANTNHNITAINLTNNFGQHNATMCGLAYAQGKYVITMDDDLQNPPEEVSKLVKTINDGKYSAVYGQFIKKRHGLFRDFASELVNKILSRVTGSGYTVTSFRIMHKSLVKKLVKFTQYNVMIDVLIKDTVANRDVGHCPVEHHVREIGKSGYSYRKLFWYAINMIFNFTLWPLRLASILGFLFSFLSAIVGISLLIYYFRYGISVSGWTSLILSISFFSGIILFVLGIIGEYLGRIFLSINQKPQYLIKEVIRNGVYENEK